MKVLLDTNILIHREAPVVVHQGIGRLFNWFDRLGYVKCIHPITVDEINLHTDLRVRQAFLAKMQSYHVLQATAPLAASVVALSNTRDKTENQTNDTRILNEVYCGRVDALVSEDRGIHEKAKALGIADKVFTIDEFLEKAVAESPDLTDYKTLAVKRTVFGQVDITSAFFDSFRRDYPGFDDWFNGKSEEPTYVCYQKDAIVAFLYLKVEGEREPYPDIVPTFQPKRRLKIGTLKVELNGFKLGERFLKIVFDNAIRQRVAEVYVTIFQHTAEHERLVNLLQDFGFILHGSKMNPYGEEQVYVRDMTPSFSRDEPASTFPFVGRSADTYLVPIYPAYHTDLLPDSILNNESAGDFVENEPHRNAIRKVYISHSYFRDLRRGDVIVFYRTGGVYQGVVTTLGIVDNVHDGIGSEEQFVQSCRKRSVFTDAQLRAQWQRYPHLRPFIVEFLYAYSFPSRPNLKKLIEAGVVHDVNSVPRGFGSITTEQFDTIITLSKTDTRIIVD